MGEPDDLDDCAAWDRACEAAHRRMEEDAIEAQDRRKYPAGVKDRLWLAIERYRTAGCKVEHAAYRRALADEIDVLLDVQEMDEVGQRFAHVLALELECVLADRSGYYDSAIRVLGKYRAAMSAIHEKHAPTHMGEPLIC